MGMSQSHPVAGGDTQGLRTQWLSEPPHVLPGPPGSKHLTGSPSSIPRLLHPDLVRTKPGAGWKREGWTKPNGMGATH